MEGIILAFSLNDYKSELKVGDLVCLDEEYEEYSTLINIDNRFLCRPDEEDNKAKYIFISDLGYKINFERSEISKAHLAFFDAKSYFNNNKKIKIGDISSEDLRNIKFKAIIDNNLEISDIDNLTSDYLIGLTFTGTVQKKQTKTLKNVTDEYEYFKLLTI